MCRWECGQLLNSGSPIVRMDFTRIVSFMSRPAVPIHTARHDELNLPASYPAVRAMAFGVNWWRADLGAEIGVLPTRFELMYEFAASVWLRKRVKCSFCVLSAVLTRSGRPACVNRA